MNPAYDIYPNCKTTLKLINQPKNIVTDLFIISMLSIGCLLYLFRSLMPFFLL